MPRDLDLGINLFAPDRSPLPSPLPRTLNLPPTRPNSPLPDLDIAHLAPEEAAELLSERAAALDAREADLADREADLADFSADVDTHHAALDDYAASLSERARELEAYEHKLFKYHRAVRRERVAMAAAAAARASAPPPPLVVISEPVFEGHQYEALAGGVGEGEKAGDPALAAKSADANEGEADAARREVLSHSGGDVRSLLSHVTSHIALLDRLERSSALEAGDEAGQNALRALALLDMRIRQVLKRAVWAEESQSDTEAEDTDDSDDEFVEYGHCSVVAHVRHSSLPVELD
ncbi:uncharacterized protein LOC62_05G007439 [Vanrija pseudolonga]|uniref:Uncharacterized protein n=1 Tax=Vanrija pseudolonga TaxID=143232 RepID=A0AAF1BJV7_9TREE|nr:hypothetical protein LOC62_05G007439 [Vanrija pseudolonga]